MSEDFVIGIDLGTTNSVVSILQDNQIKIFQDEFGNKLIPSFVSLENENKMVVGELAKNRLGGKLNDVIFDVKRFIGRTYDDINIIKNLKNWPFKIINDPESNTPKIEIETLKKFFVKDKNFYNDDYNPLMARKIRPPTIFREFFPEEVSSFILKKLKEMAESELKKEVKKAVITVPAYFNNTQRESTKLAGELAGLEVLRIINEPTAAALAYGLNEGNEENKKILIFDLGGGTFDVTILSLEFDDEKIFEVLSTDGDTNLGGNDFDQELYNLAEKYFFEECDIELEGSKIASCKVKKAVEKAKKILSEKESTTIELRKLYLGRDLIMTFTRKKFEEVCKYLFDKCLEIIDNALELAKLKENDINEVVLIGGSTRIPYVREMLKNKFKNSKLCYDINPDEAVSIGAAIQGAIIVQKKDEKIKDINLFDVTPFSLGVELKGDKMDVIIKRNTAIPIRRKKIYSTVKNNQTTVEIKIYEGEDKNIKKNHLIGKFCLNNLPKLNVGKAKIEVTFYIDENNILNVSAKDVSNELNKNEIVIVNKNRKINDEQIKKIKENMKKFDENENKMNLNGADLLKNEIGKFKEKIQNSNDKKEKYKFQKKICENFENFMEKFDLEKLSKNEDYLEKFNNYLIYLIKEYYTILSYENLIEEDVIKNIKNNLFIYVIALINNSKNSIFDSFEDFNINKEINDFCCIFRILENYAQGIFLYKNNELNEAEKYFSLILKESSIHNFEEQLNFIDENSQKYIKNIYLNVKNLLNVFKIQISIEKSDKLYENFIQKKIIKNNLMQLLDSYNLSINLNKNEKDEIIDKYKFDYCVYRINEIISYYLNNKNKEMKNIIEKLQIYLKSKNDANNKERKKIEDLNNNQKIINFNEIKIIKNKYKNLFKDNEKSNKKLDDNIKNLIIELVKIILDDFIYIDNINNEYYNVEEIFSKEKKEIKKFIDEIKSKYSNNEININNINNIIIDKNQDEKYKLIKIICAHIINVLYCMEN